MATDGRGNTTGGRVPRGGVVGGRGGLGTSRNGLGNYDNARRERGAVPGGMPLMQEGVRSPGETNARGANHEVVRRGGGDNPYAGNPVNSFPWGSPSPNIRGR